jgi:hypothetical protein
MAYSRAELVFILEHYSQRSSLLLFVKRLATRALILVSPASPMYCYSLISFEMVLPVVVLLPSCGLNGSDRCLLRLVERDILPETVGTLPREVEMLLCHSYVVKYLLSFYKWNVCRVQP